MSGPELGSQERVWAASGGSRLAGTELTAPALLVDFGSTFTKLTAVDTRSGALVGSAQYRTTVESDLMDGFSAGLRQLRASGMVAAGDGVVLGCSSAGGGLRVAIVGLERDLTAEAAKQVALNSGGRIVAILTRGAGASLLPAVQQSAADLVLLVGGTDGGDEEFAVWAARSLAVGGIDCPVVFAGNTSARARVAAALDSGSITWRAAPNVLPEIGRAEVDGVQSVIREAFIEHVIKGKRLSASDRFGEIVALPTPDAVLEAVKLVARGYAKLVAPASSRGTAGAGEILVVDVGGATTDVYSSLSARNAASSRSGSLVPAAPVARTVEADLGLRWSAEGLVAAARERRLVTGDEAGRLAGAAGRRAADPGFFPQTPQEVRDDLALARLAVVLAISRHAGRDRVVLTPAGAEFHRHGRDVRQIQTVMLTGGVFRAHAGRDLQGFLNGAFDHADRRRELVPAQVRVVVDSRYILAAVGLLSVRSPELALRLVLNTYGEFLRRTDG
jgi:uncharacterized protein (TIGR01319 family)